ncbi:lipase [Tsukamurella sp. 8F]|uniref:esterase/lipase family protein n=1 Tax=unclassified Tsukamurella TaxID=2633480 RepID=UPI0023B957C8|nr:MULTISPECIES: alpha/beta fold hydrolase [unclassified Tsukamurella]MDF0530807.1 lipase [Tsukamurella sp. 8J]MDF0588333.1 lipase [Tsukamurella sp. 8F]
MTWARRTAWAIVAIVTAACMGAAPGAAAPPPAGGGWNDFHCRPSARHPQPVVFAHGMTANGLENWFYLSNIFARAGYCVFTPTYGQTALGLGWAGGLDSLATAAAQLGYHVDQVRKATGAKKVDIIGHSEGTTVAAYYMKALGGARVVDRYAGFGTNYRGTTLYGLTALMTQLGLSDAIRSIGCGACADFAPGSTFLRKLNSGGTPAVPGPHYLNISSENDEVVLPYTSGQMPPAPNVRNVILQQVCPTDLSGHLAMAISPNVAALILRDFDPEFTTPLECFAVVGDQKSPPSVGVPFPL